MPAPPDASPSAEFLGVTAEDLAQLEHAKTELERLRRELYEDPPGIWLIVAAIGTVIDSVLEVGSKISSATGWIQGVAAVLFHSKELRGVLERVNPALGNFLGEHVGQLGELLTRGSESVLGDIARQTLEGHDVVADATDLASLKRAAADVATKKVSFQATVDAQSGLMSNVTQRANAILTGGIQQLLTLYTSTLQERRGELPENVNAVAADMVASAVKFGMGAQLAAFVLEIAYPLKYTGVNQLVGYIADFAGFSRITGPLIDPQLKWGLGIPAEYQAAKLFRTRMPSSGDVLEQAYQRHVSAEDLRRALRLEGYPEDWIEVRVADMFVDPRPREIITLTEGLAVDPAWLTEKFRENGWDDADVARAVDATIRRARAPAAERYARTISTSFVNGYRTIEQVRRALGNVTQDDAYVELWTQSLEEERNHRAAEQLAAAVLDQYNNDIIGPETTDEMLEGLGFAESERRRRRAVAALKRHQRLVKEDLGEIEQQARQLRTQALTTLRAELRARRMTLEDFEAFGRMLGYQDTWVRAIGDLELTKPAPRTVPDASTVGLDRLARELRAAGEIPLGQDGKPLPGFEDLERVALANIRAQLRAGILTRADFVALGQMLGVAELTLQQMADVELLRSSTPPEMLDRGDAEELARSARSALVDLAGDLVQRRVIAAASALEILREAGVPVNVADVAIAIAEVLGQDSRRQVGWPFESLSPERLVWQTVLRSLTTTLQEGIGDETFLGRLLDAIGAGNFDGDRIRGVFDTLQGLFGRHKKRSHTPPTVERPGSPSRMPLPEDERLIQEQRYRVLLIRQILDLRLELESCYNDARAAGFDLSDSASPFIEPEPTTPVVELEQVRNELRDLLRDCRTNHPHTGGTVFQPPTGGAPPTAPPPTPPTSPPDNSPFA